MTTATTIEHHRQKAIAKMLKRLESVELATATGYDGNFTLYGTSGTNDSGIIISPDGFPTWSAPELMNLLEMIAAHGKPTNYRVTFRNQYRTWSATLTVPAGKIALDEAGRHAEMGGAELLECVRIGS